ncbi:short-chain dehydrogenase/reductase family 16C member 6-like isoform X2 [Rhynchophorus ferrugineus]|uniref:short-chain dehydrogenase/reductase family 16C member 6-like isoform X2 n=1 Tax=Rhynchophorus ferrugineus TaxID=354439 RepID=UPI003FCD9965
MQMPCKFVKLCSYVTGAGHGIGRELAIKYASEGAAVILWDINEKGNEETAKLIVNNGCRKPYTYTCDVSNRKNVLEVANKVKEEVGDVTILVNNAGIMPTHPLEKHTEQEIRKIMDINVLAHFWTLEAFLPAMKANNHGHIVALSSIAGVVGIPNLVPYSASKFAVRGYMEALTDELNWNSYNQIKTTVICPFMVNTGLCKKPFVKFENMLNLLEPKDVAEKIVLAQRSGIAECTIPNYLLTVNNFTRLLTPKVAQKVKTFFESGVHSDL